MDMEKTAWIIILLLNLSGILLMIGMSAARRIKNSRARFEIIEEDELFDTRDLTESEKAVPPEKEKAPAGKPVFDIDDFDFDI